MHPRKPMWALPCALLLAAAAPAVAETRYVYLVNDTADRIESFALAQTASDAWSPVDLGSGGMKAGTAETIAIVHGRDQGCVYDAKIVLRGGRTFIHRGLDFCRYASYHPGRYLRSPAPVLAWSGQDEPHR